MENRTKVVTPPPPPLHTSRIAEGLPFQYTGVDFSGPLLVKGNPMTRKVYICLFTCAVIRAAHLEIVEDLTVVTFLRAFRRFISIRGVSRVNDIR